MTNKLPSHYDSCFYREISCAIIDRCLTVKGWKQEYRNEIALSVTTNCYNLLSQCVNQSKNGLSLRVRLGNVRK